jgi:hypothetical protein
MFSRPSAFLSGILLFPSGTGLLNALSVGTVPSIKISLVIIPVLEVGDSVDGDVTGTADVAGTVGGEVDVGSEGETINIGKVVDGAIVVGASPLGIGSDTESLCVGSNAEPLIVGSNAEPPIVGSNAEPLCVGSNAEPLIVGLNAEPLTVGSIPIK